MASKVTKLKTTGSRKTALSGSTTMNRKSVSAVQPVDAATTVRPQLRMRDMIERMVERSGMRKGEARSAIEAVTAAIADAIERGDDLDLPDLGKLKMQREKTTPNGKVYSLKLVRRGGAARSSEALAEDEKGG